MKIAFPTNDGLTITPDYVRAKGFLVLSVEKNKILQEDLRWIAKSNASLQQKIALDVIGDCDMVILRDYIKSPKEELAGSGKEIYKTCETIIINAFVEFVNENMRREANYCCSP